MSDIHGHAEALSAVLATAERRGWGRVLVAGDICFPGPEPLTTWRRLSQLRALCVQGVGDRAIATVEPEGLRPRDEFQRARLKRLVEVRRELGPQILTKLAKLPAMMRQPLDGGSHLLLVHGSPTDPLEPMSHDMDDATIAHLLGTDPAAVVLCGGSHVPFDRLVARPNAGDGIPPRTRVVNLGSVGEAPEGDERGRLGRRAMSGYLRPQFAHATFVESRDDGIEVEQFIVPLGRAA